MRHKAKYMRIRYLALSGAGSAAPEASALTLAINRFNSVKAGCFLEWNQPPSFNAGVSLGVSFCRQIPASLFRESGTDARFSLESRPFDGLCLLSYLPLDQESPGSGLFVPAPTATVLLPFLNFDARVGD